jgi:ParB family transcriptional regulator, chromosome partitioning protein
MNADNNMAEKRTGLGRGLDALLPGRQVSRTNVPPAKNASVGIPAGGGQSNQNPHVSFANVGHPTSSENSVIVVDKDALAGARLIPIDAIERNPYQTRGKIDESALDELSASIREQGVLQPILVRLIGSLSSVIGSNQSQKPFNTEFTENTENTKSKGESQGQATSAVRYQLMAGERRWMAAQRAGLKMVPAVVKAASDEQAMEITIIENLQREDLNPMEQARAFERLSREFALTQEQIAVKTGKDRASVANFVRLLKLPAGVQQHIEAGTLSLGHGKVLMMLQNEPPEMVERVAARAAESGMSVRELEELVLKLMGPPAATLKQQADRRDPNVVAAEQEIQRALGCRVKITDRQGKGRIVLEYGSLEDFDRILEALSAK